VPPFCLSSDCSQLPDIPHAHVSDNTKKDEYQQGNVIRFTCETGYISGPPIRYVCSEGGWIAVHEGTCYLKPCELPDDTPNGYYEIIKGEDFVFGTTIKYFCNRGYQMVSKDDTRTCLLDRWTNHVPICETREGCGRPPPLANGDTKNSVGSEYRHNDRVEYGCQSSYTMNGEPYKTCNNGEWTGQMKCLRPCTVTREIMNRYNIHFSYSNEEKLYARHDEVLTFSCNYGRRRVDSLSMRQVCNDGVMQLPSCQNQKNLIVPIGCLRPLPLADGDVKESLKPLYRHNERVEYVCQRFYTMDGNPYRTCNNGEWTGNMRCLKPCTVAGESLSKHNIRFRYSTQDKLYLSHNDVVTFSCTVGRRPGASMNMRPACNDGVIDLPSCQ
ncbi:complement factor H-related protein 2-like, partial [Labrus mixtus]|uniref:complement factor H-related protein 2-like n=1 Tax=Labrus mixtus TaxID=508554 RepID=UPI0029BFE961